MPPSVEAVPGLRVAAFGAEAVVFDPLSWNAHLLNPAAWAVLELLLDSPCSTEQIAAFLQRVLRPDEQTSACLHARHLIDELVSLGLVRPVGESALAVR